MKPGQNLMVKRTSREASRKKEKKGNLEMPIDA